MADYPAAFESFSSAASMVADGSGIASFSTSVAGFLVDDVAGVSFISAAATPLGFKACRLTGAQKSWLNKVWDPGGGGCWVLWETLEEDGPDENGEHYPDPYGSGFSSCSGFRAAGTRYS